jgi:hypothetical protein
LGSGWNPPIAKKPESFAHELQANPATPMLR